MGEQEDKETANALLGAWKFIRWVLKTPAVVGLLGLTVGGGGSTFMHEIHANVARAGQVDTLAMRVTAFQDSLRTTNLVLFDHIASDNQKDQARPFTPTPTTAAVRAPARPSASAASTAAAPVRNAVTAR